MTLHELESSLLRCSALHEVITLSRTWYWTAPKEKYNSGERLIVNRAKELNKVYSNVKNMLILRS